MEEELEKSSQIKTFIRDTITVVVVAAVIILVLQFVMQKFVVEGSSMNFTLHDGQQLLVNKIVYNFHEPERGDIIVFHPPVEIDEDDFIKRIIGLPGEKVVIANSKVIIQKADGSLIELDEPYITRPANRDFEGGIIPEGEYFVMGDNRVNSSDSRTGWTLKEEDIIGKAWISVWPIRDWGLVSNHDYEQENG
ncbi:MAG: signal peptidase I [Dehalococcoidales bacterium]|nr:signal peptidase I [Dehalococcoidales bacterium]